MTIVKKIILSLVANRYCYSTNQTEEQIQQRLKELTKSVGFFGNYQYNLTGFFSTKTFFLHRRSGLWLHSEPVTIYGKIIKNENNKIDFEVEIKPYFGFLLFVVMGIFFSVGTFVNELSSGETYTFDAFFCLFFPISIWINAYTSVAYYKEEFEKAFELEPAIDPLSSRIRL